MCYYFNDATRTGERNAYLNKNNTSENVASNEMFYPDERTPSFIFKQIVCAACIILYFGSSPSLTMFYTNYSSNAFYKRKGKILPNLTPKPKAMEAPNLAYGLVFTTIFQKNWFRVHDNMIVTSQLYF